MEHKSLHADFLVSNYLESRDFELIFQHVLMEGHNLSTVGRVIQLQ